MLGAGHSSPEFKLKAIVSSNPNTAFSTHNSNDDADKWNVVFCWPKAFTFASPTVARQQRPAHRGSVRGPFAVAAIAARNPNVDQAVLAAFGLHVNHGARRHTVPVSQR